MLASAVPVEGPRLFFEYSDQDVLELFRISEWRRGGVNIVCGCEDLYGDAEASQIVDVFGFQVGWLRLRGPCTDVDEKVLCAMLTQSRCDPRTTIHP